MSEFSIVSINILNDLSYWKIRRQLLVDQLLAQNPDLIALQEVSLKEKTSNAHWIAAELNRMKDEKDDLYNVYLCPKTGSKQTEEGIAILSRLPVKRHEILDLLTQNRVAQLIEFRIEDEILVLVNGHFFWEPGESQARDAQVELLLDWLDTQPADIPVIVAGDFNSTPKTKAVLTMRQYFDSAHRILHGYEPEYTCPTPLPKSNKAKLRSLASWALRTRSKPDQDWKGTLDYIFVDPRLHVIACEVVLNQPVSADETIYPSDHFGLYAAFETHPYD